MKTAEPETTQYNIIKFTGPRQCPCIVIQHLKKVVKMLRKGLIFLVKIIGVVDQRKGEFY